MILAPIVVFGYDRPDHLKRTLKALAENDLASRSDLYIYCDGAREWGGDLTSSDNNPDYVSKRYGPIYCPKDDYLLYLRRIEAVRQIAKAKQGFNRVLVIERKNNIGLADNIVGAVTELIEQCGRIIVFEDDIVSTRGCLTYLNDALELYKDDEQVMHISAWMYPNKGQFPETFFYDSPYPAGGWATWKRAWEKFNPNAADHVAYWENRWKEFDIEGGDLMRRQLLMNADGRMKTWYIKWYSSMRRANGLCLYPGTAMSNNIGWDNTGETSLSSSRYHVNYPSEYTKVVRIPIKRNRKAFRFIRAWYSGHWYSKRYRRRLIDWVKHIL